MEQTHYVLAMNEQQKKELLEKYFSPEEISSIYPYNALDKLGALIDALWELLIKKEITEKGFTAMVREVIKQDNKLS